MIKAHLTPRAFLARFALLAAVSSTLAAGSLPVLRAQAPPPAVDPHALAPFSAFSRLHHRWL